MMDSFDAVVIGGGPIGCRTASLIAQAGFSVCILEEHYAIGQPVQCAGIVSPRVLDLAPFKDSVRTEIYGAHIHSPRGRTFSIRAKNPKAIVIDRPIFDIKMSREAVENGAELMLGCKATDFSRSTNDVNIKFMRNSSIHVIKGKLLIGADGMQGTVAKRFMFPKPQAFLIGIGAEVSKVWLEEDMVDLFAGREIAPGFFAWIIPLGNRNARIGLCLRGDNKGAKSAHHCFNEFISLDDVDALGISERNIGPLSAGAIPVGALKKTVQDRVMLVGDAAAHAKPTSGGGIFTGLCCAERCGSIAVEALNKNDYSEKTLEKYDRGWRRELGSELRKGWYIHNAYASLDDDKLEEIYDIINRPSVLKVIEHEGDLDFASSLAHPLLKEAPALIKFAGPLLKSLF